jgi:predicted RNA polymerase sigma factor
LFQAPFFLHRIAFPDSQQAASWRPRHLIYPPSLEESLADYYLWHATRADFLRRLGQRDQALDAYGRAHALAQNETERRFLSGRIGELTKT